MLGSSPDANFVVRYSLVRVARLRVEALWLNLNILMLYGNMEQLTKLQLSILALLTCIGCSSEFIDLKKNILKYTSKFADIT